MAPHAASRLSAAYGHQGTKMSSKAKMLTEQARALPPQDRIALVEDVLDSLDRADPDIDQLWAREASDRLAAYRRGELAARDLRDIIAKYRPIGAIPDTITRPPEGGFANAVKWERPLLTSAAKSRTT
jgi:putative addiction module component (TIGR02574 family)